MTTASRTAKPQRPASAMANPWAAAAAGLELARTTAASRPPSVRGGSSSKEPSHAAVAAGATTKSERRRSLPAAAASPDSATAGLSSGDERQRKQDLQLLQQRQRQQQQQQQALSPTSSTSLSDRRRASGMTSPALTLSSSTRSTHSDRVYDRDGGSGRVRTGGAAAGSTADELFSIHRLRSNSGLSLHTNSAALRRYTDYNADGSSRLSPTDERFDADGRPSDGAAGAFSPIMEPLAPATSATAPGLFSWEAVRAVLDDPVARQRLWDYARAVGGAENLDFLEKVEQYNHALNTVTVLMATISTAFTGVAASAPLHLPPHVGRALNADVKHVSSSILPGLAMLFDDADLHIKERVLHHIYPGFARRQLSRQLKAALGATSAAAAQRPFRFEGLGHAFCLTDPYRPDIPIVYASESFARVMGYARAEDATRTGRFARGLPPGNAEPFADELVLSRNGKDGLPFWSLVASSPLQTSSGRVRFVLSSLVDLSDAVKTREDIVRALSAPPLLAPAASPALGGSMSTRPRGGHVPLSTHAAQVAHAIDRPASAVPSAHEPVGAARLLSGKPDKPDKPDKPEKAEKAEKALTKSFFNPFSRKRRTDDSTHAAPSLPKGDKAAGVLGIPAQPPPSPPPPVGSKPSLGSPPSCAALEDKLSIYARFMVLQYVPGSSHEREQHFATTPTPSSGSRRGSRYGAHASQAPAAAPTAALSRLKVAFSSLPMLDLLGLGPAAHEAVLYHDVFAVLSELAGSPSITPAFQSQVRQRMAAAEPASLEISVPACGLLAPGAFSAGLGAGLASPTNGLAGGGNGGGVVDGGSETATGSHAPRRASVLPGGARHRSELSDDEAARTVWDHSKGPDGRAHGGGTGSRRRRSGTFDRPGTSERRAREAQRLRPLMSHWTPLKDVDGVVAWVVLVMAPVVSPADA